MATTALTLDGFPLIGTTTGGGRSKVTGFDGWLSASVSRARGRRTVGHGSWSSAGWRAEKPMEIAGLIRYATAAEAAVERRNLLALGGYGECALLVTDANGTLTQSVEVDDIDVPPVTDALLRFHIEVTATDPFARSTTPVTVPILAGTTENFTATGTVPAELEVTTTSSGTVHVEQGGLAIMASSVPSGTVFTSGPGFDNLPRSVVGPGGEDLYSLTLPGTQWPAVVPGANSILNQGTAAVQVRYFPTYA